MTAALTLAVGIAGNATGILLYASPIPIFVRIVRRRSTEAFSGVTFAFSALSTAQWTYFAIVRGPQARPLATLTAIGFAFQFAFNCIYLRFASKSQRVLQLVLLAVAASFYACMVTLTTLLLKDRDVRANVVGLICTINAIFYSASPLIILRRVIKSGSTEFLPFYLPLFFFLSGVIWSVFAFLTRDLFIAIPNGVNILMGGLQLIIHVIYKIRGYCTDRSTRICNEAEEGIEEATHSNGHDGGNTEETDSQTRTISRTNSADNAATIKAEEQLSQITLASN